VQFELGGRFQSFGARHVSTVPVLMRVGLGGRVEARLASDGIVVEGGPTETSTDLANAQASAKVRLLGRGEGPRLSVLPAFTFGADEASATLLAGVAPTDRAHVGRNTASGGSAP